MKANTETIKLFISALIFFASIYFFVDTSYEDSKHENQQEIEELVSFNFE